VRTECRLVRGPSVLSRSGRFGSLIYNGGDRRRPTRGAIMTEQPVQTAPPSSVPSASEFTSSPLRNRLRLELDAPVSEVWELLGDLSRFPEYSVGLERVERATGACASRR
jgi:hypothetical protein